MAADEIISIDSDEEKCLPSAGECLKLCETFVDFTETNSAIAMMFLQQNSWNLEVALGEYYSPIDSDPQTACIQPPAERMSIDLTASTDIQHSGLLRVLCWNIDGLSNLSRKFRTKAVIEIINNELFHIICLQEVVKETLDLIKTELGSTYSYFYPADIALRDYFPAVCVLNHPTLQFDPSSFNVIPFSGSVMQRILLSLDLQILSPSSPPRYVRIWTTHLESCHNFSKQRQVQLRYSWQLILDNMKSDSVPHFNIFCGDLNIRDSEIKQLGDVPSGMCDVWEATGSRPEAMATWDPRHNNNLSLEDPSSSKTLNIQGKRFDRMYCAGSGLRPVDFELKGLEKVVNRQYFPSDHWAILGHFVLT